MLRCRVLLVDDEPRVLAATARLLSTHFDVTTASSLGEASVALASASHDVLVTDLSLGADRGEDLLLHARAHHPAVARVVLSGTSAERVSSLGELAELVLHKVETEPADIVAAVRSLCRSA